MKYWTWILHILHHHILSIQPRGPVELLFTTWSIESVDCLSNTGGQLHVPWRDASSDANLSKTLVLQGMFGPSTSFCNWNFRTPAWVNNVIGMHESCLGQLPWDRFTGRVHFTEGFLCSGYQLGFLALLISLEFFPHTCSNSSKVVNDVLVGLSFGNYYRESL